MQLVTLVTMVMLKATVTVWTMSWGGSWAGGPRPATDFLGHLLLLGHNTETRARLCYLPSLHW